jgi:hypothetical protein
MSRIRSFAIAGATLLIAIATGYIMQYGLPGQGEQARITGPVEVTEIAYASSGTAVPRLPSDTLASAALPDTQITFSAADPDTGLAATLPQEEAQDGFSCDLAMRADTVAGAMVDLTLSAPCNASERVTIHHQGLMFTEVVQPDGTLKLTVPALNERAMFIASFASGAGTTASTEVGALPFYDRVVLQWKGKAGLQLHAREFDADYFTEGHIWAAAAGDLGRAARGEGGFMTRLGQENTPEALVAEIYSFPTGTAKQSGAVKLTVEAEVTAMNCADTVAAQTLELPADGQLRVRDLALEIPGCDSTGDFLVLKNLVQDLKVAAK